MEWGETKKIKLKIKRIKALTKSNVYLKSMISLKDPQNKHLTKIAAEIL